MGLFGGRFLGCFGVRWNRAAWGAAREATLSSVSAYTSRDGVCTEEGDAW